MLLIIQPFSLVYVPSGKNHRALARSLSIDPKANVRAVRFFRSWRKCNAFANTKPERMAACLERCKIHNKQRNTKTLKNHVMRRLSFFQPQSNLRPSASTTYPLPCFLLLRHRSAKCFSRAVRCFKIRAKCNTFAMPVALAFCVDLAFVYYFQGRSSEPTPTMSLVSLDIA